MGIISDTKDYGSFYEREGRTILCEVGMNVGFVLGSSHSIEREPMFQGMKIGLEVMGCF